jgi:hypothetical protein
MENKKFLCPKCDHKPFRNATGLTWHLEHQHGIITRGKDNNMNQRMTPAPTDPERQSSTELPIVTVNKLETKNDVDQKEPANLTIPDLIRSRGATMSDFERLLKPHAMPSQERPNKEQANLNLELTKLKNELENKLDARLQVFTERDSWLSGRISKLEQALKIDGQQR